MAKRLKVLVVAIASLSQARPARVCTLIEANFAESVTIELSVTVAHVSNLSPQRARLHADTSGANPAANSCSPIGVLGSHLAEEPTVNEDVVSTRVGLPALDWSSNAVAGPRGGPRRKEHMRYVTRS